MADHWKIGQDFAIRYGGPNGIEWFQGKNFDDLKRAFSASNAATPIGMAIEASKAVALFLQWWEMRKQTMLQTAEFEERRINWLVDIIVQWSAEVAEGQFRLDTVTYLNREAFRFLDKVKTNDLIDAPSTLLLQIERITGALVSINQTIYQWLKPQEPNFTLPGTSSTASYEYVPYWEVLESEKATEQYFGTIERLLKHGVTFGGGAVFLLLSPIAAAAFAASAGVTNLIAARKRMKESHRLEEFGALQNFCIELRSSLALLSLNAVRPQELKLYKVATSGKVLALSDKGSKRN